MFPSLDRCEGNANAIMLRVVEQTCPYYMVTVGIKCHEGPLKPVAIKVP